MLRFEAPLTPSRQTPSTPSSKNIRNNRNSWIFDQEEGKKILFSSRIHVFTTSAEIVQYPAILYPFFFWSWAHATFWSLGSATRIKETSGESFSRKIAHSPYAFGTDWTNWRARCCGYTSEATLAEPGLFRKRKLEKKKKKKKEFVRLRPMCTYYVLWAMDICPCP